MPASDFAVPFQSSELAASTAASVRRGWRLALLVGGWTLYGLLFALLFSVMASPSAGLSDARGAWLHQLVLSLLPAWAWAACTPLIVRTTRRLASRGTRWWRAALVHGALALALCVATALVRRGVNLAFGSGTSALTSFAFWLDHNIVMYAVLAGVTHALDLHGRWLARARRELALQAELAGAKLQFLRRQLQPHFLFNCLNATAELTREDPPRAQRMLRHLQRLLRSALARSDAEEVPLRDELATLEPYVELQRMRFGDALTVVRKVDPAALDARVPVFILQPLVENAVQHGLAARRGGGTLEIVAEPEGTMLRLEVRDNGSGRETRRAAGSTAGLAAPPGYERRGGIGLRNTRARLVQLYGAEQSLELVPRESGGTAAVIHIPFRPLSVPSGAWNTVPEDARSAGAVHALAHTTGIMPAVTATDDTIPEPPDDDASLPSVTLTGEMPAAVGALPPPPPGRLRMGLALAAFWVLMGGLWMAQGVLHQYALRGFVWSWSLPTLDLWNAVAWALLTPLVLALARRVRVRRRGWAQALGIHLAAALVVDVVHMKAVLTVAGLTIGLQRPVFDFLNINQLTLNFVIYVGLVTWSHARQFAGWHRTRVLSQARLDTALAQARWRALALELRPEFLLVVLERIAQLAPQAPERAERLVERLADFMRGLLDTVGRPMQPLRDELALLEECLDLWAEATAREVALDVDLPVGVLARPVSSGTFRALTNTLVARDPAAGERVALRVGAAPRSGRLALTLHSSVPIRPDTGGDASPYVMMGAAFPDARTAELDLGPAEDVDVPRVSASVIPA